MKKQLFGKSVPQPELYSPKHDAYECATCPHLGFEANRIGENDGSGYQRRHA